MKKDIKKEEPRMKAFDEKIEIQDVVEGGANDAPEQDCETPENICNFEIASLKSQIATLEDRLLRSVAESQNIRKIAEKEKADIYQYGATKFAKDILAIRDNLKLAISNATTEGPVLEGVKLTMSVLDKTLSNNNIEIINALNTEFDPHFHQAVVEIEHDGKTGIVVQVMQDGFMIGDRLLRPVLVGVSKKNATENL